MLLLLHAMQPRVIVLLKILEIHLDSFVWELLNHSTNSTFDQSIR